MNWTTTRLKHLAAVPITNGVGEPGSFDDPDWPRYVRTTDIAGPRSLRTDVFASLPPDIASRASLRRGDIVMTAAGATVGKSMLYDSDGPACFAGYLARFRPRRDVDPRFVSYWMESTPYWDQINSGKVVSTIDNFSAGKYQNLQIAIPDWGGQQAIADCLDAETARIDRIVAARSRQLDLLAVARRSTLRECLAVAEASTPSRLKRVARFVAGGTPATDEPSYWGDEGDTPWVAISDMSGGGAVNVTQKHVTVEGRRAARLWVGEPGTVLLAMYASVGATAILGIHATWNQAILGITPVRGLAEPRFLRYWLEHLADYWPTVVKSNTQDNLNAESVREGPFPMVPVAQQAAIADQLDEAFTSLDRREDMITRQIDLLVERRQALVTAAVTGQLDIPGVAA